MDDIKAKPLRVALIISGDTLAAYPTMLQNLLVGLGTESVKIALICPPSGGIESIASGPVDVLRYPPVDLPLFGRFGRAALVRRLDEFEPSVIHCMCRSCAPLAAHLSRRLAVPYVLTVNAIRNGWRPFAGISRDCSGVIVPAPSIAAAIAQSRPRLSDRIEQINVGTFAGEASCCFAEPSRIATIVLAHPFDNVDELENFFGALRNMTLNRYEFMALVMGGGREEKKLRELIAALDLLSTVTIIPMMRPSRSVFAAGDIFVQPRPSSAFNPFLLEAMAAGAAVAACKGGVDDLIVEDKTAVVFNPDDEMSIVATLTKLLSKREFARKIARAGQDYVRENHSVSNMIVSTVQTYKTALDRQKSQADNNK